MPFREEFMGLFYRLTFRAGKPCHAATGALQAEFAQFPKVVFETCGDRAGDRLELVRPIHASRRSPFGRRLELMRPIHTSQWSPFGRRLELMRPIHASRRSPFGAFSVSVAIVREIPGRDIHRSRCSLVPRC